MSALPRGASGELRSVGGLRDASSATYPAVELDLIVPALNEGARIGPTIRAISEQSTAMAWPVRIIVVDNGSVDDTSEAVDLARQRGTQVEIIGCRIRGKGAAVREGILSSSALFVGFCDADLSTPPAAIAQGLDLLHAGWDVVIGSRRCAGAGYVVTQSFPRRIGSFVFRSLTSQFMGGISDSQCGFKLFRADVGHAVFSGAVLDGFAFDVEILSRVMERGDRIIELPIQWSDHNGSSFRWWSDSIETLRAIRLMRKVAMSGLSELAR